MNGYMKIRVMSGGRYADCWQQIKDGQVVAHVDDDGAVVGLPDPHEAHCLTGQLMDKPNGNPVKPDVPPLIAEAEVAPLALAKAKG